MQLVLFRHKTRWLVLVITLVAVLTGVAHAQQIDNPQLPGVADIRIVVDISGSMKKNDPQNLRRPAVRLLARLLPDGTTAGVWTFGQFVNMLVPHREVSDAWRDMAISQSDAINSVAMRTNLGKAIEIASDGYFSGGVFDNTHFIVLTDGMVDISANPAANKTEAKRILDSLVPPLKQQGARFHAVALSAEADTEFLRKLASDSGGSFHLAENADDLSRAFVEALNAAVPQEQTPIDDNGFMIDAGVGEYTALVFWGENETATNRTLLLQAPDASAASFQQHPQNISWAREPGYDLITVTEPVAGRWNLDGQIGEGSRVSVVSDLRMIVSPVPGTFSVQEPLAIQVALFEGDTQITNADFLSILTVSLKLTAEDGRSGSKVLSGPRPPTDGVYRDTIAELPDAGPYQIAVEARSSTFARKFSGTSRFRPAASADLAGAADAPLFTPDLTPAVALPAEPDAQTNLALPDAATDLGSDQAPEPVVAPEAAETEKPEAVEPAARSAESDSADSAVTPWMMAAGAGLLLVLVGGLIWFLRRKRKTADSSEDGASADAKASVIPQPIPADVPLVTDIEESENPPELSSESAIVAEQIPQLEPEPALNPELEPEPLLEPEPGPGPEPGPLPEPLLESEPEPEEAIPLVLAQQNDLEPLSFDDDFELSAEGDEPAAVPVLSKEPADDEFGPDDFDLSGFDDLAEPEAETDTGPGTGPQDTPDKDRKK